MDVDVDIDVPCSAGSSNGSWSLGEGKAGLPPPHRYKCFLLIIAASC